MNLKVEGAKLMLSQPFSAPVEVLFKNLTEPVQISKWFQPSDVFTTNYVWGFVCSNGTSNAGLCFGKFCSELPPLANITTPEEKTQLPNFSEQPPLPTKDCPVITVWCQDSENGESKTNESNSQLWFRHVFADAAECQQVSESPYVKFWQEQFRNLADFLDRRER